VLFHLGVGRVRRGLTQGCEGHRAPLGLGGLGEAVDAASDLVWVGREGGGSDGNDLRRRWQKKPRNVDQKGRRVNKKDGKTADEPR